MKIRCLRTAEELRALAPRWNALLQASGSDSIFLTWEWISIWWDVFGKNFSLRVLTAHNDAGELVGIAPLMIGRMRSPTRASFRALMLIGQQGDTMAEYLDFIIQAGREAEITAEFCAFIQTDLAAEWDFVFFERILTTSPNLPTLASRLSHAGFSAVLDGELKSPFAALGGTPPPERRLQAAAADQSTSLPPEGGVPILSAPETGQDASGGSWPDFLAAKSRNFRNQWNNSWNRLQAEGDVKFLFAGRDLPLATALAEVTRLHRERWEDKSASFKTENYLKFHERLCERFHAEGWLLLLLLSVNGKNVAVRYDYVYANKLWCMQGGWSPEYAAKRVGTLLTGKVIEWGIEHGLREYDFLGGDSDYKRRWSNGERVMINLTAGNATTFRGRLWRWNRGLENFARKIKGHLRAKSTATK